MSYVLNVVNAVKENLDSFSGTAPKSMLEAIAMAEINGSAFDCPCDAYAWRDLIESHTGYKIGQSQVYQVLNTLVDSEILGKLKVKGDGRNFSIFWVVS